MPGKAASESKIMIRTEENASRKSNQSTLNSTQSINEMKNLKMIVTKIFNNSPVSPY